ncbi:MAG: hypothetical protein R2849_03095 [Thermomicrobiales bacterium]
MRIATSEFWNLVFMEFNQLPGTDFEPLMMQNVDTGSGLERRKRSLQGRQFNL